MEGAALAARRQFDLAITTAWHTEAFARTKKLPKLASLIGDHDGTKSASAQALAFFHGLKAKGVPVEIYKTERKWPVH
jgi:hypothetical protein